MGKLIKPLVSRQFQAMKATSCKRKGSLMKIISYIRRKRQTYFSADTRKPGLTPLCGPNHSSSEFMQLPPAPFNSTEYLMGLHLDDIHHSPSACSGEFDQMWLYTEADLAQDVER